ncbi:MAG TPA: Gfo/Idh/MocA family oxidoreductase, partial [Caldilineaceae bacterium]|nr:Gfo/Idh/MocA family oxidoreductase [Caldilineaceae bacterium]
MIRAAFIGAGARSVSHMRALTYLPDVQVAAVAELDETRAQAAQARANERRAPGSDPIQAQVYRDYRQMLEAATPDVVYLCLPPYVHGQIDHDVVDYGRPVLFEKPLGLDMGMVNEVADHIRARGIVNAVGYQKRYSSAVQAPRKLLAG